MALAERDLFRGYGLEAESETPVRVESCACGGEIAVASEAPAVIQLAVQQHQQTAQHAAWRRGGLHVAERQAHVAGEPVPDELLLRGRRCPCGGHA